MTTKSQSGRNGKGIAAFVVIALIMVGGRWVTADEGSSPKPCETVEHGSREAQICTLFPDCLGAYTDYLPPSPIASQSIRSVALEAQAPTWSNNHEPRSVPRASPECFPASPRAPATSSGTPAIDAHHSHYEFIGLALWRSFSSGAGFAVPGGAAVLAGTDVSFRSDLGFSRAVGPVARFIWTPDFKVWGATSKFRVEYNQVDRTQRLMVNRQFEFQGQIYVINTDLEVGIKSRRFQLAYSPRWGNDKFRIGPMFAYENLNVLLFLKNLTPGAPPPIERDFPNPNNLVHVGFDFDYTPVQRVDLYGFLGTLPCCGGGWHALDTEYGAKLYVTKRLSFQAGIRYTRLRYEFHILDVPGYVKWPGVGPFIGMGYRF